MEYLELHVASQHAEVERRRQEEERKVSIFGTPSVCSHGSNIAYFAKISRYFEASSAQCIFRV